MDLASAIVVFIIENYLKLFLILVAPSCSLWKYYNSLRDPYIIILELTLVLSIGVIMFASLALTKMDCTRIANYFMLPILLGLTYFNMAYYHRVEADSQPEASDQAKGLRSSLSVSSSLDPIEVDEIMNSKSVTTSLLTAKATTTTSGTLFVDSIELVFSNGLGALTIVQLFANLLSTKRRQPARRRPGLSGSKRLRALTTTATSGQSLAFR